jgi:formate dehydrogenase subunit beta
MTKPAAASEKKGAVLSIKTTIQDSIRHLLKKGMDQGVFDAVLIPMRVPAGDSFSYVLIKDKSLLNDAVPLPPAMSVQGAKAVSSVTRLGTGSMKIAAVMRPCEIRATIELIKLDQVHGENMTLISIDCPGVMPILDFIHEPEKAIKLFENAAKDWDNTIMRPVCQICDKSSMMAGDLHIGTLGTKKDAFFIISNSQKGKDALEKLNIPLNGNIDSWQIKVKENAEEKQKKRKKTHRELKTQIGHLDNLLDTFSQCINCHNCMRVCPVCYCRLCYFDSDKVKHPSEEYLQRAKEKGSIRFLPDTTLFHMGRMMHMSLSCVSCGSCEDACPMSIPVAQIFSMVADETQGLFEYVAGRSSDEPLPLKTYEEDELHEVEDAHD